MADKLNSMIHFKVSAEDKRRWNQMLNNGERSKLLREFIRQKISERESWQWNNSTALQ